MKVERGTDGASRRSAVRAGLHARSRRAATRRAARWTQARASLKQEQSNLVYARTELARQDSLARANAGTPTAARSGAHQLPASPRRDRPASGPDRPDGSEPEAARPMACRSARSWPRPKGRCRTSISATANMSPPPRRWCRCCRPPMSMCASSCRRPSCPKVQLGQKVRITCDGCKPIDADHHLHRRAGGIHPAGDLQRRQPREAGVQAGSARARRPAAPSRPAGGRAAAVMS